VIELKKKVVFVISSLGKGGAERVVSSLANSLCNKDYDVSVILVTANRIVYKVDERIKIYNLNGEGINKKTFIGRMRTRIKNIKKTINAINPDVVVSFLSSINIETAFAMKKLKTPLIVSERNDPAIDPQSRIKRLLRKIAYKRPNGFVFQTPDAQKYFNKKIQNRSRIILNPLTEKLPEPYVGERDNRVVAVGRLEPQKNYRFLLDAFAEFIKIHPEYILEIYGDGEQNIQAVIEEKQLQDKVILKGFSKTVLEDIKSAGMYVMSSKYEGLPNALMEAMALGLPCISTDCPCGGPRLLIRDKENGLLVPLNNVESLVTAMQYVAENKENASQMAEKATKLKEIANLEAITNQWMEYIDVCSK